MRTLSNFENIGLGRLLFKVYTRPANDTSIRSISEINILNARMVPMLTLLPIVSFGDLKILKSTSTIHGKSLIALIVCSSLRNNFFSPSL